MSQSHTLHIHPDSFGVSLYTRRNLKRAKEHVIFENRHIAFDDLVSRIVAAMDEIVVPSPRLALKVALRKALDKVAARKKIESLGTDQLLGPLLDLFMILDGLGPMHRDRGKLDTLWPRGRKGAMIRDVWIAWRRVLGEAGRMTRGDVLAAYALTVENPQVNLSHADELVFVGFDRPEPVIMAAMFKLSRQLPVRFDFALHHDRSDLHSTMEPFIAEIEKQTDRDVDIHYLDMPLADDVKRNHLVMNVFGMRSEDGEDVKDDRISAGLCLDRAGQVRYALRLVRKLLDNGLLPETIGIVAPDLDAVRPWLREGIRQLGLPLAYNRRIPLLSAPCFRWLYRLIDLQNGGMTITSLTRLGREASSFGLGPDCGSEGLIEAEACLLGCGIDSLAGENWQSLLGEDATTLVDDIESWVNWIGEWRQVRSRSAWLESLSAMMQNMKLPLFKSSDDARYFALSWHARETARSAMEEWERLLDDGESIKESGFVFLNWLIRMLDTPIRLRSHPEPEAVAVLSPGEAAQASFEHLIVLDMIDGVFPGSSTFSSLLSQSERSTFNRAASYPIFQRQTDVLERDRLSFFRLLLSAERLTLLGSLYDEESRQCNLSAFLRDLLQPQIKIVQLPDNEMSGLIPASKAVELLVRDERIQSEDLSDAVDRCKQKRIIENERFSFTKQSDKQARNLAASEYTGKLADAWLEHSGEAMPKVMSPGHFEKYSICPFYCFTYSILKLQAWEKQKGEPDPIKIGLALHSLMERIYKESRGTPPDISKKELKKKFLDALLESSDDKREDIERQYPFLAGRWAVKIRQALEDERDSVAECGPKYFETVFGKRGAYVLPESFSIDLRDGQKMPLTGRIDRLDIGSGKVFVVDYKSSNQSGKYGKLLNEAAFGVNSFQMPIYMAATLKAVHSGKLGDNLHSIGASYDLLGVPLRRDKLCSLDDVFTKTYFADDVSTRKRCKDEGQPNLYNQLAEIIDKMSKGEYFVTPQNDTVCDGCKWRPACRVTDTPIED